MKDITKQLTTHPPGPFLSMTMFEICVCLFVNKFMIVYLMYQLIDEPKTTDQNMHLRRSVNNGHRDQSQPGNQQNLLNID